MHQDDINDDNHDMKEEAISVFEFEWCELDHNVQFALQKRVSCFAQVQHIEETRGGWNVSRDRHVVKFTTHICSSPYRL